MTETTKGIDELTGIPDNQEFTKTLDELMQEAIKNKGCFSLAISDIDRFKNINDEKGHAIGDQVIRITVNNIRDGIADRGTVFRYGGDEFAALMLNVEKEEAFLLMEQIRLNLDQEHNIEVDGKKVVVPFTVSIGIASYPEDGQRGQDITRKADDAIYRAKTIGRNRVCLAREERMVTKTSHYTQGQLERISQLAKKEGVGEAILLREALDDIIRKYDV